MGPKRALSGEAKLHGDVALALIEGKKGEFTWIWREVERGREMPCLGASEVARLEDASELIAQLARRHNPPDLSQQRRVGGDAFASAGAPPLGLQQWCGDQRERTHLLEHSARPFFTERDGHNHRSIDIADHSVALIEESLQSTRVRRPHAEGARLAGGEA